MMLFYSYRTRFKGYPFASREQMEARCSAGQVWLCRASCGKVACLIASCSAQHPPPRGTRVDGAAFLCFECLLLHCTPACRYELPRLTGVNILSNGLIGLVKVSGFAVLTDERLNGYRRASNRVAMHFYDATTWHRDCK